MKIQLHFLIAIAAFFVSNVYSQGSNCASAEGFCTSSGSTFPASTNTVAETGPNYGCLITRPDPAWYYLKIDNGGTLNISLTNSANVDIDFICWGPFMNLGSACSNLTATNIIDCSYTSSPSEEVNIGNAVSGEFYMLLITNFSASATNISADLIPGSTGSTDCSVIVPCTDPVVNAGPDQTICAGSPVTLAASGTPGAVYTWNNGVTNNVPFTPGTTQTYTVTGVVPGECQSTDQVTVTVVPMPVVNAGPDQTVCSGLPILLAASGTAGTVYTWDNGVTDYIPFVPNVTKLYTVTATAAGVCQSTDQVEVTVVPTIEANFTSNVTNGCGPLTVTFTNLSGGTDCIWDFGDGTTGSGTGTVTHTYTAADCYDVSIVSEITSTCTALHTEPDMICIHPDPEAKFTASPNVMTHIDATSRLLNNSVNMTSCSWSFGDGDASSAENPIHTFPEAGAGEYTVRLVALSSYGCRDTAYATIIVNEELLLYVPNTFTPDGDEFNQSFEPVFTAGFDPFDFKMAIFNRWGEIVFETNDAAFGWDGTYNGKIVQGGTYTWKISFKTVTTDARKEAMGYITVLR